MTNKNKPKILVVLILIAFSLGYVLSFGLNQRVAGNNTIRITEFNKSNCQISYTVNEIAKVCMNNICTGKIPNLWNEFAYTARNITINGSVYRQLSFLSATRFNNSLNIDIETVLVREMEWDA